MTNFTVNNTSLFSDNEIHKIGNVDIWKYTRIDIKISQRCEMNEHIGEMVARYISTMHNKSKSGNNYNQNVYDQRSISTYHKIKFHGCL